MNKCLKKERKREVGCLGATHVKKTPERLLSLNGVQACLNNWHYKLLHIGLQKPSGQIIVTARLMCCLYSRLFLENIMRGKCCFGVWSVSFCFLSVTSDEEQVDWTLLASAVPSTSSSSPPHLKVDMYLHFEVFPLSFVLSITKYKQ